MPRRSRISLWLASGSTLLAFAAPPMARASTAGAAASEAMAVSLPLKFDGAYQGDITAQVTPAGEVALDRERFISLLGPRISPAMAASLRAAAGSGPYLPLAAFAEAGVTVDYDAGTLELAASIPVERQGAQTLKASDGPAREAPRPTLEPAPFAATAILRGQRRYRWKASGQDALLEPMELAADLAANLGGVEGISLFGQLGWRGGREGGLDRGNVLLVHDDMDRAIRYSAGDIAPAPAGFQTSPLIGGLSVERQYGAIQPFRNVRPSGRFSFILERRSTVDLVVNGTVLRTIQLDPGQYSLSDFPFFNGLNQVELFVVDGAGRRLLASFSQYFSARLLGRGLTEFGAAGGVLQQLGGSGGGMDAEGTRYLRRRPAFSGYARRGLTDHLTAGANLQLGRGSAMAGLEAGLSTPVGTFGSLLSVSRHAALGRGRAALLSYEGSAQQLAFLIRPQLNLEVQAISRGFAPLQLTAPVNRYRLTALARFTSQLPAEVSFGASVGDYRGRDGEPDQRRYGLSLGRRLGPFNATAAWERVATRGPQRQQHLLTTLTMPLGRSGSARSSFDTRGRLAAVEYSRFLPDEIDSFGWRASVSRGRAGLNGAGEASFNHNRFAAVLQHSLIADRNLGEVQSQESSLSLSTQLAFSGGRMAMGRPVGPRFAIISAHPTLEGASVEVRQGAGRAKPQARTGLFGPALATAGNSYTANELRVDVDNLPPGYDIGSAQQVTVPGPAAGYRMTVGSDASRMLLGIAVDPAGEPLGLLGGTLVRRGAPKGEPVLFFTNRAGRFAGNGLSPGTYELVLGTDRKFRGEVTIREDAKGVIDIGTIKLHPEDGR